MKTKDFLIDFLNARDFRDFPEMKKMKKNKKTQNKVVIEARAREQVVQSRWTECELRI
jgi:hypothetical protein